MSENKSLFREKSLEQFSSPEQLNDYIRVANPSVFLLLGAVIAFLVGVVIWGMTGTIDTHVDVRAVQSKGILTAYVPQKDGADLTMDSLISVNDKEYSISAISDLMLASDALDERQLTAYGIEPYDLVYAVSSETTLADGSYSVRIIMAKLRPSELVLN